MVFTSFVIGPPQTCDSQGRMHIKSMFTLIAVVRGNIEVNKSFHSYLEFHFVSVPYFFPFDFCYYKQFSNDHHQILITEIRLTIFFAAEDGEALYTAKTRLGADYCSDHELLIAKFRLKLKKVGKTTRPLRYDLNQILYNYTVKVTDRFKALHQKECLKSYAWRFVTL